MGVLIDRVNELPRLPRLRRWTSREASVLLDRSQSRIAQIAAGKGIDERIGRIDEQYGVRVATFDRCELLLLAAHFEKRKQHGSG